MSTGHGRATSQARLWHLRAAKAGIRSAPHADSTLAQNPSSNSSPSSAPLLPQDKIDRQGGMPELDSAEASKRERLVKFYAELSSRQAMIQSIAAAGFR